MKRSRGLFRTGNRRKGQLLVRAAAVVVLWLAMVVVVAPTVARAEDNELWGDHWGFAANGGASATFADDRSVAHAGQASLKVTNGSGFAANVYGTVWQTFATKPNTTYDFHAWVRSSGTESTQFTVTGDWAERFDAPDGNYDWHEMTFQHTTSAGETSLTFRLIVQDVTTAFWLDDVSATEHGTTQNLLQNTGFEPGSGEAALYQRFATLDDELPTLQGLIAQARRRGIAVDYPTVDASTIGRFIPVGRNDIVDGQGTRAGYIAGVLEQLYAQATSEVHDYLNGTATAVAAPHYVTGQAPLAISGRSFVGDTQVQGQSVKKDQTVFLTGYGHFNEIETDIPRLQDLGNDAVQFEIGPASTIFPATLPGWQPATENALQTIFRRDTSVAHSGGGSLLVGNLSNASAGTGGTIAETVSTKPNTTYRISLWVKGSNASKVTVVVGNNGPALETLPAGTYGWKKVTLSYTTAGAENTMPISVRGQAITGSTWLDDVGVVALGTNVIDNGGFERTAPAGAAFAVDDTLARTRIATDLESADRSNVAVNLLLSPHYMPQFVYDQTPNLKVPYAGFLGFDINNPAAKAVVAAHIHAVMSVAKKYPSLQSITLTNEPIYVNSTTSGYTQQMWHDSLRKLYPTVSAMNAIWGTSYASFDAVPASDGTTQASPYYYDWVQFNDQMFAGWHAWMATQVHAVDPNVPVQAKIMSNTLRGGSNLNWGVDTEQFDNLGQINGDDNYGFLDWGEDGYAQENEFYDLQSTMKDAPVFNSEDHIIPDFDTNYGPLQATNARMTLWQGAIHGRSGSTIWVWMEAFNSMLVRPDVVDQVGRTGLDLNRLAGEVTAFQNSAPKIGILYSTASNVYTSGSGYVNATNSVYKSLLYDGQKAGFVSEGQAAAGGLGKYDVLVLPRTTNVQATTLAAIQRFEAHGGKVVIVGEDALTADEHNQPLPADVRQAVINGAAERFDASISFDALRTQLMVDTQRWGLQTVRLIDASSGQPVSGVEYETVRYHGKRLLNVSSYRSDITKSVYVEVGGKRLSAPLTDLISGKRLATGPLTLAPITPLLFQLPVSAQ